MWCCYLRMNKKSTYYLAPLLINRCCYELIRHVVTVCGIVPAHNDHRSWTFCSTASTAQHYKTHSGGLQVGLCCGEIPVHTSERQPWIDYSSIIFVPGIFLQRPANQSSTMGFLLFCGISFIVNIVCLWPSFLWLCETHYQVYLLTYYFERAREKQHSFAREAYSPIQNHTIYSYIYIVGNNWRLVFLLLHTSMFPNRQIYPLKWCIISTHRLSCPPPLLLIIQTQGPTPPSTHRLYDLLLYRIHFFFINWCIFPSTAVL